MTTENSMKWLETGVESLVILLLVLTSSLALGQAVGGVGVATNSVPESPKSSAGRSLSPDGLQARVEAQQQEINELKAMIKKLEVMVDPQASMRPVIATSAFSTANVRALVAGPAEPGSPAPEPTPSPLTTAYTTPRELLPDIGQIGAEVGLLVGGSQNPYKANKGFFTGGYIDLPLRRLPGGKLSYEILISLQRTTTTTQTTSGVTALVNAVVNAGTPFTLANLTGPFPITTKVLERSTVLTVAPVELKYTVTTMGRFRPYVVAGLGMYTSLSTQSNAKYFDAAAVVGAGQLATVLNAVLQGPQVAGLVPEAPELRARGVAAGQGDMRFGLQYGGGLELRVTPKYSLGFDYRQNRVERINAGFGAFTFKQAFHF